MDLSVEKERLRELLLRHTDKAKTILKWDAASVSPDTNSFFNALVVEPDRGCVLVAIAFLESQLGLRIHAKFVELSQPNKSDIDRLLNSKRQAPLGSFAMRTTAARCLGVITEETKKALDNIRGARNDAAHLWEGFHFSKPMIDSLLSIFDKDTRQWINDGADIIEEFLNLHSKAVGPLSEFFYSPSREKLRFIWVVVILVNRISSSQSPGGSPS